MNDSAIQFLALVIALFFVFCVVWYYIFGLKSEIEKAEKRISKLEKALGVVLGIEKNP